MFSLFPANGHGITSKFHTPHAADYLCPEPLTMGLALVLLVSRTITRFSVSGKAGTRCINPLPPLPNPITVPIEHFNIFFQCTPGLAYL